MDDTVFTTDTILEKLYGQLAGHPEDDGPAACQKNILLLQNTEIAAYISLYREAGKLWVQMRIGYMFGTAVCIRRRRNFRTFMMRTSHNPLRLPSGQSISLGHNIHHRRCLTGCQPWKPYTSATQVCSLLT